MKYLKAALFAAASIFLFFFLIPQIPLWSSDEGRYADIAAGMFRTGDYIFPRFNYLPFLDKPVLAPVLTAFSFSVFGLNSFAARLPTILAALAGLLFCYQYTRRFFNEKTAVYSAVILLTTIGYVLVGRFAVIDMLMTLMLSLANGLLLAAFLEKKARYYIGAYIFMGLGFLTKGLIGIVLPAATYFFFLLWTKNLPEIKRMRLGWGILIIAAIILPWCIAMQLRQSDFFDAFIIKQHFSRFATGSYGRRRPVFFFVPIFFLLMFPWSFFFPAVVRQSIKKNAAEGLKSKFLLVWFAVIFIFFSIPKSKLPYYILPLSIPVAILTGNWLSHMEKSQNQSRYLKFISGLFGILGVALLVGGPIAYLFKLPFEEAARLKYFIWAGGVVLGSGLLAAGFFIFKERLPKAAGALALTVYAGLIMTASAMYVISPYQSTYTFAQFLKPYLKDTDRVAVYASPDKYSDFIFYMQRRVIIAGPDRGNLKGESHKMVWEESLRWFIDSPNFAALLQSPKDENIYLLISEEKLPELLSNGLKDYRVLKHDHGKLLITQKHNNRIPAL